jgi:hypothetical protein
MKTTRDDSILAWGLNAEPSMSNSLKSMGGDSFVYGDILAASPLPSYMTQKYWHQGHTIKSSSSGIAQLANAYTRSRLASISWPSHITQS